MTKKHFMCTHTFVSQEAAKQFLSATLELTDRQIFEGLKTEKAEMLAHWRGEEEFFFCHWYAETDDDIFAALEAAGFNDLMHTLPNEMQLFLSAETIDDKTTQEYLDQP